MIETLVERKRGCAPCVKAACGCIGRQLLSNVLPISLVVAILLGLFVPEVGRTLQKPRCFGFRVVQTLNIFGMFLLTGLGMKSNEVKTACKSWGTIMYALVAVLLLTPSVGFALIRLPLSKPFATGLAFFCCMPAPIGSVTAIVLRSKGNVALGVLISVLSNLLGVFSVPFALKLILQSAGEVQNLSAVKLLTDLLITVLAPVLIGKAFRDLIPGVQRWVDSHKTLVTVGIVLHLAMIVMQGVAGSAEEIFAANCVEVLVVLSLVFGVHLFYLLMNWAAVVAFKLKRAEAISVVVASSSKMLSIALAVLTFFEKDELGPPGLVIIPCLLGHMNQILFDSFVFSLITRKDTPSESSSTTCAPRIKTAVKDLPTVPSGEVVLTSTLSGGHAHVGEGDNGAVGALEILDRLEKGDMEMVGGAETEQRTNTEAEEVEASASCRERERESQQMIEEENQETETVGETAVPSVFASLSRHPSALSLPRLSFQERDRERDHHSDDVGDGRVTTTTHSHQARGWCNSPPSSGSSPSRGENHQPSSLLPLRPASSSSSLLPFRFLPLFHQEEEGAPASSSRRWTDGERESEIEESEGDLPYRSPLQPPLVVRPSHLSAHTSFPVERGGGSRSRTHTHSSDRAADAETQQEEGRSSVRGQQEDTEEEGEGDSSCPPSPLLSVPSFSRRNTNDSNGAVPTPQQQ
uniref:Sodium/bile acid cotransporter n=1 Tax=Chromera velia CCMP2878 TaxID=1169474 RepID=A0A0G4GZ81_9ALVE|eukprot:Cvel_23969.t1-p1 / transcript=Cvel_23969.t1 / gene=Cvel_23969 / organism=Chromera_velia_CCMP2878 / gene_product=Probable sodium/metabolite cotransporter BASS4,, putative / transcript_product=Probable sodium/metabolite cotransporter BASS4,, putative / location=Cvel_scaffold2536:17509-20936(-) / protein_length=692 / sequence_SO=supercontig / SO=protein_coding / is_pseudo=false